MAYDEKPAGRVRKAENTDFVTRYALLVRGVNVGTKNSLPMVELREMLTKLGCSEVETLLQSGNAVFGTKLATDVLQRAVEAALERYMGRPIATTLRTREQFELIVEANPFEEVATNHACLCVTFLTNPPTSAEVAPLYAQDFEPALFRVAGTEIYSWHPEGQGRSPLAAALDKLKLRGGATTRNWNTVLKLLATLERRAT